MGDRGERPTSKAGKRVEFGALPGGAGSGRSLFTSFRAKTTLWPGWDKKIGGQKDSIPHFFVLQFFCHPAGALQNPSPPRRQRSQGPGYVRTLFTSFYGTTENGQPKTENVFSLFTSFGRNSTLSLSTKTYPPSTGCNQWRGWPRFCYLNLPYPLHKLPWKTRCRMASVY